MITDGERPLVLIEEDLHFQIRHVAFEIALLGKRLQLLCGIHSIGDHLAQENLMVRIKKFFYDREDILGSYTNITFLHIVILLILFNLPRL